MEFCICDFMQLICIVPNASFLSPALLSYHKYAKSASQHILWSNDNKLLQVNYINVEIFILKYRLSWKSFSGVSDPQLWLF